MNNYNPQIHHRRSIRLKGYDYSSAGLYFITMCCENRINRFGHIVGAHPCGRPEMDMNQFGQIAFDEWLKLSARFPNFELDVFQIMPNHIHVIIFLKDVGANLAVVLNNTDEIRAGADISKGAGADISKGAGASPAPTVSDIVGAYKSLVANRCLEIYKLKNETMGKFWQRNYYEHIIRDVKSYETISNYIINNPSKWAEDKFYSA